MEKLERAKKVTIKAQLYSVKFPTVGDFIDIEVMKQNLSGGTYGNMLKTGLITQRAALDRINMIAYFSVLIPELKKDLKVDIFSDIDLIDSIELVQVYKKEIEPWIEEWLNVIKEGVAEESTDNNK